MAKERVLIVDDDAMLRALIASMLRSAEYQVAGETGMSNQVLKLCSEVKPHLVLLDINLPGTNGLDLLDGLKQIRPEPRVVMISGDARIDRVKTALSKGAHGFVVKPFNAARLLEAVERALEKK